jgi:hypothetical protein
VKLRGSELPKIDFTGQVFSVSPGAGYPAPLLANLNAQLTGLGGGDQ